MDTYLFASSPKQRSSFKLKHLLFSQPLLQYLVVMLSISLIIYVLGTSHAAPSLDLKLISSTNGDGFYSVNINNEEWLQSGQLEAYLDKQWYSSNATKAKDDDDYLLMNMISSSTTYDLYDDFGGKYMLYVFEWQAGTVIFETNFKVYSDGKAISFVQSFPSGVPNTNFMAANIPNGCGGNAYMTPPMLSFPSFNVANKSNKYANGDLGFLTWRNTFSGASWGKAPLSSGYLAGINGGPVVLYDDTNMNAIVVSTNDNFGVSTQVNALATATETAVFMNDSARNDSLFCLSPTCFTDNENYENRENQGISANSLDNDIIGLKLYFSSKYQDNYVATGGPPDNTYTVSFANGYIYSKQNSDNTRLSVDLYYSKERQDHATVATQDIKDNLKAMGYVFVSTQGYIDTSSKPYTGNNDWRLGISSQVMEIPEGFQHETVIVAGEGITNVILDEWSSRLQSKYHTSRLDGDADIVTSHLGYWTDDVKSFYIFIIHLMYIYVPWDKCTSNKPQKGAYYYGDDWQGATSPSQNLTCCSLEEFKAVRQGLDKLNVPIRYMQMDDWWYKGLHPSEYSNVGWGGVKAVQHWEPPEQC